MVAGAQDAMQPLLVKIAYQLQVAAEALGGADASMPYATMVPGPFDTQQVLLVKIAYWAKQVADNGGGGGGGSTQVYTGAAPPAAPANPAIAAVFYPTNDALPLQAWNVTTQAWRDV